MDQNEIENLRFDEYHELHQKLRRLLRSNAEEAEVLDVACRTAECCDDIQLVNSIVLNLMRAGCMQSTVQTVIEIAKNIEAKDPVLKMEVASDRIVRYGDLQLLYLFETLNNWTIDNPLSNKDYYNFHSYFARYMQQYVAYFVTSSARYTNLTVNADSDFLTKEIAYQIAHEIALEKAKAMIAAVDRSEYCLPRMTEVERNTPLPVKKDLIDMFERLKEYRRNPEEYMKAILDSADSQRNTETDFPKD